jgi:hypothetical protein
MEVHITTTTSTVRDDTAGSLVRRAAKPFAVGLTTLIAVIYLLIGLQVLTVLDNPDDQTAFALIAAAAFAVGAGILAWIDSKIVFGLGAAGVAFVIFTYFSLATERSPQFETWGIVLRVIQALLFVTLAYLTIRSTGNATTAPERPDRQQLADETTAGVSAESGPTIHGNPPV